MKGRPFPPTPDQELEVWDIQTGKKRVLYGHKDTVNWVTVASKGRMGISASDDETLKVWDLDTGKELKTLQGHTEPVLCVAVTPDGKIAVSGSDDQTVRVWHPREELPRPRFRVRHQGPVTALAAGGIVAVSASSSDEGKLVLWDLRTGEYMATLDMGYPGVQQIHDIGIRAVGLTRNGRYAVSGSHDGSVAAWDLSIGRSIWTRFEHKLPIVSVAVTPDGRTALTACGEQIVRWNLQSGDVVRTIEGPEGEGRFFSVATTSAGMRVFSASVASGSGDFKAWNLQKVKKGGEPWYWRLPLDTWDAPSAKSRSEEVPCIWRLLNGKQLCTLKGHTEEVNSVAVTRNGSKAVSASSDSTLRIWSLKTGKALLILRGHTAGVSSVVLTTDGKRCISASYDQTVKVWDLGMGRARATFNGEWPILACAVSPDCRTIVVGYSSGRVHFLRLEGV